MADLWFPGTEEPEAVASDEAQRTGTSGNETQLNGTPAETPTPATMASGSFVHQREICPSGLEEIVRSSVKKAVKGSLDSALQEAVRSSVSEAMQSIIEVMLPSLHNLSAALKIMAGSQVSQEGASETEQEYHLCEDSKSGSGSGSGLSHASGKGKPSLVLRALDIQIPSPEHLVSCSKRGPPARSASLGIGVLPPLESKSPSLSNSSMPVEQPAGSQSNANVPGLPGEVGHAGLAANAALAESQKSGLQAELEDRSRQSRGSSDCLGGVDDDNGEVKETHKPDHHEEDMRGAGRCSRDSGALGSEEGSASVRKYEEQYFHRMPAVGSEDGATSLRKSKDRKEKKGARTPVSLHEMEDDCLILNLTRNRLRKKSRKASRQRRDLSKIVPGVTESAGLTSEENNVPEIDPGGVSMTDRQLNAGGSRKVAGDKYDIGAEVDPGEPVSPKRSQDELPMTRIKTPRTLEQLRSDHAQNILDNYTGLEKKTSSLDQKRTSFTNGLVNFVCGSRLFIKFKDIPEYCLAVFGITQLGRGPCSKISIKLAFLVRLAVVSFIVVDDCMMLEPTQIFYSSYMHSILALGALAASTYCLWDGGRALLGGRCDAIKMYAADNNFLDAWRAKSFRYFCLVVAICSTQSVLLSQRLPFRIPEECEDVGLRKFEWTRQAAHILVVGSMAMLAFLHLRMCAGLQLMVDSFCEDFKMGMHEISASSQWITIHGIMNKATNTIGVSFLIQISAFVAALGLAGADVLVGHAKVNGDCAWVWLQGWIFPSLLGFLLLYVTLVESGRLSFKCSCVASFVSTVRYEEGTLDEASRQLRQYLVNFIHQTSSGFHIQGVRVTTFVAFKLGWAALTASFAIWAHSRST